MRLSKATQRLAEAGKARQRDLLWAVDAVGTAAGRAISAVWRRLLTLLRAGGDWASLYQRSYALLDFLPDQVSATLRSGLGRLYQQAHRASVLDLQSALTLPVLFEPPAEATLLRYLSDLVRPADWVPLGTDDDKRIPHDLAQRFANLASQGQSQRDVAKALLPYFEGTQYRARRFARTIGLDVAHQAQLDADQGLGDMLVGYQVHAVHDEHTRPWHASRDGTVYYRDPKPGQKGWPQMPRPPREAPDSRERPPNTPALAFNCRCYLTPILAS